MLKIYVQRCGYFGGGAEGMVDVKDGKIVRVRPMRYGWKYNKEEVRQWKIERNGKSVEPSWQSLEFMKHMGIMYPAANIVKDTSEHADMVLFWGGDPGDKARRYREDFQ